MATNSSLPAVQFARALEAAGVVTDLDSIERIIIDVNPAELVTVYVKRVAGPQIREAAGLLGEMMRDGRAVNPAPVVHACPPDGAQRTPCCGKTPFDLPRTDQITTDQKLVTCTGGA